MARRTAWLATHGHGRRPTSAASSGARVSAPHRRRSGTGRVPAELERSRTSCTVRRAARRCSARAPRSRAGRSTRSTSTATTSCGGSTGWSASTWPLQEKLTLFWHDHFATRDQDTPLMLRQNRMLRQYGMGSFRRLLRQVTRDPAMQLFLSLADSHKDSPNENYARELMELFTLAAGYDERDVREAARALTGWRVSRRDGQVNGTWFDKERYDDGAKRAPRPPRPVRHAGGARHRRREAAPRALPRVQALGLLHHRAARQGHEARARAHLPRQRPARSCPSSRRSWATARCTRTSTTPTWSRARSSSWPARCAGRARRSRWTATPTCSGTWGRRRSARRASRAGTGARRG